MQSFVFSQYKKWLLLVASAIFLSGCATDTTRNSIVRTDTAIENTQERHNKIRLDSLNKFYRNWQGTPYRYGGLSRQGVDCSGFVFLAYKKLFNYSLPRVTKEQVKTGKKVDLGNLTIGDLVFFKTSKKVWHVGVYVGDGQFMHASTSVGVTISRLDNQYWAPRYRFSRRILD